MSVVDTERGATPWAWADLTESGPEAETRAQEEERQRLEVEDAYRRGLNDGERQGTAVAREELKSAVQATVSALEEIRAARESWESRLQERLVLLAAAIASKIVGRELQADSAPFVELARSAVAAFPLEEAVRIRLHPADREIIANDVMDEVVGERAVRWITDEDVTRGGCIVEGPDRIVDARVDEALVRIVGALTDD